MGRMSGRRLADRVVQVPQARMDPVLSPEMPMNLIPGSKEFYVLSRSIFRVLLACLVVTLVGAASASAAAPSANDDTMTAAPNGVRDVLYNDSDSDGSGSAMRVVGTSQPAHGKASCSALGSCFYQGDQGYSGPDTFTYTVRDAGAEESTATVHVTVQANNSTKALIARDDDAAAQASKSVTVKVLDNDGGGTPPLTVVGNTAPQHGAVTCDDTTCTYTPADGYAGSDGFRYTIKDASGGDGRRASADVHLLVAPESAGYGLAVRGAPDDGSAGGAVPSGGLAHWFVGVTSGPDGITGEELGALPLPSATATPGGPHSLVDGAVKTATGWKAGTSGGTVTLEATKDALLGEGVTEAFPKPLPPISQGTGGDGHVPIL